jgi:hypothetical protein
MTKHNPHNEYRQAVDNYIAVLNDLLHSRMKLQTLQRDPSVSADTIQRLERRVAMLTRLVRASQNVVARKEEGLAE